jgi:polysaccharide export outer membrane protein
MPARLSFRGCPVSFGRCLRISLTALVAALAAFALSGCMLSYPGPGPAPVVDNSLDAVAYGGPVPPPPPVVEAVPVAARVAYAATPAPAAERYDASYRLDAGDRLRIVVYGQEGLTNSYAVDAGGHITMPLIGAVPARGRTPAELARAVAAKLRSGYIREPYVAAEVEQYRPFFILGEVTAPGQYPYVPNLTAESAVAIAGGFTPRALKSGFKLTRRNEAGSITVTISPDTPLQPGDTVVIGERWF